MSRARDEQVLAAIRRVLEPDERILGHGRCWVAVRRPHVALLFQRRRRGDAIVTDHRLVLVARRRGALQPSDVTLVKRFESLTRDAEHTRPTLLQQHLRTDQGVRLVVEWPLRSRALGRALSHRLPEPRHRAAA